MDIDEQADAAHQRRLSELRRAAFSRATTPAERENAAEAQRLLAELEGRDRHAAASAAEPAPPEAAPEPVAAPETESPAPGRRRTLAIAAALVAVLAVGFGGGVLSAVASQSSAAREAAAGNQTMSDQQLADQGPSTSPYLAAGTTGQIHGPGDSDATERWFATPQQPEDIPETLPNNSVDMTTFRLVYGAEWGKVWAVKATDGSLCLYTSDVSGALSDLECADRASFDASGLVVNIFTSDGASSTTLRWDGWDVLVAMSPY